MKDNKEQKTTVINSTLLLLFDKTMSDTSTGQLPNEI